MATRNFNVKNGLTVGVANIDAATGNILTTGIANVGSLAVVGLSNLGNVGNVTITGGTSGFYLQTNGSGGLTWAAVPTGTGISNGSSSVTIPTINSDVVTNVNGTTRFVATTTGANVTGNLGVSGNTSVGNISATNGNFTTGNMTVGNITTINSGLVQNGASNLAIAGGGGNVTLGVNGVTKVTATADGANVAGTLGVSGNANSANFGTGTLVASAANTGLVQNGTSNVTIATSGNVSLFVGGATPAKIIATSDGANVNGNFTVSGNANVGNLGTTQVVATGNISTTNQLISTATSGSPILVASTTVVANLNASLLSGSSANAANTGGTIALRDAAGNIAANFFIGNGSQLSGLQTDRIASGTSNVVVDSSGSVRTSVAGVANVLVVTSSGANITGTANISGNANVGNLGATGVVATGNITASTNLISDNILGRTGALTITSAGTNTNINLRPNGTGNIDANATFITSVKNPINLQDAATKDYVDRLVSTGISIHPGVNVATTTTLAVASGGTVTYNQPGGAGNGVGATLTTTGSYTTIDGQTLAPAMRILVKDEANAAHNGVYVRTSPTVLTRSLDTDTYALADPDALSQNDYFFVATGTLEGGTAWICSTVGIITFGTTNIVFSQFSAVQEYTAGTGLTLTPSLQNQFKITDTAVAANSYGGGDTVATFTVNQQGQLTAAANVVNAPNAANLTGTVLPTGIQSNITRTGTVTVGTWNSAIGSSATFAAGLNAGNLSNIQGQNVSGAVTSATNANAVLNNVRTTGTYYPAFISDTANGNYALNSNTAFSANLANGGFTATTFIGNLNGAHNGTVGATTANTGAFTTISASGQITSTNTGTAPFVINSTTRVANLNVANAGFADAATNAAAVQSNTSTGTSVLLLGTSTGANGNVSLEKASGISANLANSAIIATTFVGNVTGTAGSATSATNAAAVLSQTSTNTLVYLTGTSNITNGNFSLEKVSGIFANMSSNSITATTGIFTTAANTPIVQNGTSNVTIAPGGNVSLFVGGATPAKIIATADGANVAGNLTISTNLAASFANFSGNATAGNMYANSGTIGAANLTGTLTTAAQPNVTSLGNLTVANVTGNLIAGNVKLNGGLTTNRSNVAITGPSIIIDQFEAATYRTAKYIISASGDFGFQSIEALLVHDAPTDAYITIYGSISSNVSSEIINLSANYNGVSGNVRVYASNIGTNVKVNLVASYVQIN